jgi:Ca2+-binding RTX toxin-like protein
LLSASTAIRIVIITQPIISGGDGDDSLYADSIFGSSGGESIMGGNGADSIFGADGNDYLTGGAGNDTLFGGTGSDSIYGEGGDDTLYDNTISASDSSADLLDGGADTDNHPSNHPSDTYLNFP